MRGFWVIGVLAYASLVGCTNANLILLDRVSGSLFVPLAQRYAVHPPWLPPYRFASHQERAALSWQPIHQPPGRRLERALPVGTAISGGGSRSANFLRRLVCSNSSACGLLLENELHFQCLRRITHRCVLLRQRQRMEPAGCPNSTHSFFRQRRLRRNIFAMEHTGALMFQRDFDRVSDSLAASSIRCSSRAMGER